MSVRRLTVHLLFAIAAIAPAAAPARAAMNGRVVKEVAQIHQTPDLLSPVLATVKRGEIVRISSEVKDGWYRALVPGDSIIERTYGWIPESSVAPDQMLDELRAAGIQPFGTTTRDVSRHRFVFAGIFGYAYTDPSELRAAVGDNQKGFYHSQFGVEGGYRVTTSWTLGAFTSFLNASRPVEGGSYFVKGTLLGLFLESTSIHRLPFKFGWSLGLGASMSTTVGAVSSSGTAISDPFIAPTGFLKITGRWYPIENISLLTTLGGRYLSSKLVKRSGVSVASSTFDVDMNAAFIEAGVQLEF